jgi:hypothetical protein
LSCRRGRRQVGGWWMVMVAGGWWMVAGGASVIQPSPIRVQVGGQMVASGWWLAWLPRTRWVDGGWWMVAVDGYKIPPPFCRRSVRSPGR